MTDTLETLEATFWHGVKGHKRAMARVDDLLRQHNSLTWWALIRRHRALATAGRVLEDAQTIINDLTTIETAMKGLA